MDHAHCLSCQTFKLKWTDAKRTLSYSCFGTTKLTHLLVYLILQDVLAVRIWFKQKYIKYVKEITK